MSSIAVHDCSYSETKKMPPPRFEILLAFLRTLASDQKLKDNEDSQPRVIQRAHFEDNLKFCISTDWNSTPFVENYSIKVARLKAVLRARDKITVSFLFFQSFRINCQLLFLLSRAIFQRSFLSNLRSLFLMNERVSRFLHLLAEADCNQDRYWPFLAKEGCQKKK